MAKVLTAPGKYIQGKNEMENIKEHTKDLGKTFFIAISENGYKRFGKTIIDSFGGEENLHFEFFDGECSKKEIERLRNIFKENEKDALISVGGGKVHDTIKAVAYYENKPVVIVPTIASTDAPTSALSVVYTEEGVVEDYLFYPKNPDIVLVDTQAVANAPARLLVAGIGDALATKFEARASVRSGANTMAGGKATKTGLKIAEYAYDILLEQGLKAKLAVEENVVTQAVEDIIEANTLISGLGFESGGLAAAHAIHDGMTAIPETNVMYHGEKVAFGTLAQLVLEDASLEEIEELVYFCREVGLPTTLEELNVKEIDKEEIKEVARLACLEGSSMYNMPFEVSEDDVYAAILAADRYGKTL